MAVDPLGRGIAFPMQTTPTGGIAMSGRSRKIQESIRLILGTQRGERLMRPEFGSDLNTLVFAPNTPATADLARHYVREALSRWEPRITLEEVSVQNDPRSGALLVDIHYRVASTFERQNLVFPFYLQPR